MKTPNELFNSLTDEEIYQAINEIKEDEKIGLIRSEGMVRRMSKEIAELLNQSGVTTHLKMAEISLLREAAYRFSRIKCTKEFAFELMKELVDINEFTLTNAEKNILNKISNSLIWLKPLQ